VRDPSEIMSDGSVNILEDSEALFRAFENCSKESERELEKSDEHSMELELDPSEE